MEEPEISSLDNELEQEEPQFVITTNDGYEVKMPRHMAHQIPLVRHAVEDDSECSGMPLNVSKEYMDHVFRFLTLSQGREAAIPKSPLRSLDMRDVTDAWAAQFIEELCAGRQKRVVYDMIIVSNYLGMVPLMMILAAKLGSYLKLQHPSMLEKISDPESPADVHFEPSSAARPTEAP